MINIKMRSVPYLNSQLLHLCFTRLADDQKEILHFLLCCHPLTDCNLAVDASFSTSRHLVELDAGQGRPAIQSGVVRALAMI